MLALALATLLTMLPDVPGPERDRDEADGRLEAVLRADGRGRAPPTPCEERTGWVGDDDPREPPPCDDEDGIWLVAPAAEARPDAD